MPRHEKWYGEEPIAQSVRLKEMMDDLEEYEEDFNEEK